MLISRHQNPYYFFKQWKPFSLTQIILWAKSQGGSEGWSTRFSRRRLGLSESQAGSGLAGKPCGPGGGGGKGSLGPGPPRTRPCREAQGTFRGMGRGIPGSGTATSQPQPHPRGPPTHSLRPLLHGRDGALRVCAARRRSCALRQHAGQPCELRLRRGQSCRPKAARDPRRQLGLLAQALRPQCDVCRGPRPQQAGTTPLHMLRAGCSFRLQ